jgi:hypothetical protein
MLFFELKILFWIFFSDSLTVVAQRKGHLKSALILLVRVAWLFVGVVVRNWVTDLVLVVGGWVGVGHTHVVWIGTLVDFGLVGAWTGALVDVGLVEA